MKRNSTLFLPFFLIFFLLLCKLPAFSQTGGIRGFVYEAATGEPVIFTNVYFYKTTIGAATDEIGRAHV